MLTSRRRRKIQTCALDIMSIYLVVKYQRMKASRTDFTVAGIRCRRNRAKSRAPLQGWGSEVWCWKIQANQTSTHPSSCPEITTPRTALIPHHTTPSTQKATPEFEIMAAPQMVQCFGKKRNATVRTLLLSTNTPVSRQPTNHPPPIASR